MKRNKGFTLIELLVVIAIIGILSSVVLASLSNARDKGKDASVKSQMASLKAQGELFYSENDSYGASATVGNVCSTSATDKGFLDLLVATANASGVSPEGILNASGTGTVADPYIFNSTKGTYQSVTCHTVVNAEDNTSAWAAEAPLSDSLVDANTTHISMYCADSTGVSRVTNSLIPDGETTCPPPAAQ